MRLATVISTGARFAASRAGLAAIVVTAGRGFAAVAVAASKRSQSQPKKSTEIDRADSDAAVEDKKKNKSRSTSRGVLNRFKGKKDEAEPKKEDAELDKEEARPEEVPTTDEVAAVTAGTAIAGASGIAAAEVVDTGKRMFRLEYLDLESADIMQMKTRKIPARLPWKATRPRRRRSPPSVVPSSARWQDGAG